MKKQRLLATGYLLLTTFLACPQSGTAQITEYWDAAGQKSGTGGGGTGNWTSSAVNWYVSGSADTTWTNNNLAQFSGTAGTVTLTGPLSAGALTFSTAGYTVAGSGQILTLSGAPTISFPSGNTTISCVLTGSSGATYSGSGTLFLNGVNTYTGGSTFSSGTVQCAASGIGAANGAMTFANGATLHNTASISSSGPVTLNSGGGHIFAATLTGSVTGGGGLTFHSGDSVLNSSAVCNYGTITMAAANRLFISTSSSIAGAKLVASASGAYIIFQNFAPSFPTNQMSFVSGSILTARATLAGGPLNVSCTNVTFPTTGTMIFNQDSTSSGAATTGIIIYNDYPTLTGNLTMQLGAGTSANATGPITVNGAISDGGSGYGLNKTSPNGASLGTLILNGTNNYSGTTTVSAGGFIIGGSGALGVTASATNYPGSITLTAATSSLTNATTATQLWSGQISGLGKLTQNGPGLLTLDSAETYTGETAINGGTLALGPSGSLSSSKISLGAGATFDVSQANGGSYTFSGTTFSARGGSSAATLNSASGGTINFGSVTISLVYDATNRPLTIAYSAGTGSLVFNNNAFSISNTGPALVQGSYPLFQLPAGTAITPSSGIFPASVTGNGLASGTDEGIVVVNAGTVTLVVQSAHHNSEVWNGADFNNNPNWSDGLNWVSGVAPTNGDFVTFSGATGLSPVMDNSYNISSLTFDANATNSFFVNNNGSGTLSISGGVTNSSTFAQTLGMPVALVGVVSSWSIPNTNASLTLNGPLSDSGNGFALSGQGTLTLAGNNTFTGGMTDGTNSTLQVTGDLGDTGGGSGSYGGAITDNGTLTFANSSAQTLTGPIADNGVIIFNSFANDTVSGLISGPGTLTQMGGNTVTLGNAGNTYSGGTTITAGTVSISADGALGTGPLTLDNGGRLQFTGSGAITDNRLVTVQTNGGVMSLSGPTVTLTGPLTGPGTLSVSGNDFILAPPGTNTIAGLHQTGGTRVFVSTAGALGAGTNLTSIEMAGVTGSVLDFQNSAPTNPQNPMVFGSGSSLTARNNGGYPGLTVSTTNVTFPSAGTMVFNRDSAAAGTATQPIIINGDYPPLTGPLTIALGGGTGTAATGPVTLNGAINDGGSGYGLTVSPVNVNSLGSLTLNGTNGYTGDTTLTAGSLTIGTNGDLGDIGPGNGGIYAGAININGSLINAASVNQTWSGTISGAGTLTQNGTGTLYLDGANTYSGATVVNAGLLGGAGTIAGDVTVNSGGGLAPGHSIGTLTINGNLTFNAGSLSVFEVNGSTPANDLVIAGASVAYGGTLKIVPSGSFTVGQKFLLFSGAGATNASNFASVQSTGLNFGFTNGVLTLLSTTATNPTNILYQVSGNTLTLSWPSDHLGWTLYSNSVSLRATNQWFPIAGSSSVISTNLTINHSQANVFFRLQAH